MDAQESTILKVKNKLDSDSLDVDKILRYLRALDEIVIGFEILKSTGIGKTVNNLRKKGGSVALLSKALVKKWKGLVPVQNDSPVKKSSPLNSSKSNLETERRNATPPKQSQNIPKKEIKVIKHKEKLVDEKSADIQENKTVKKQEKASSGMQLCDLGFVSNAPVHSPRKKLKTKHSTMVPRLPGPTLPSAEEIGISLLPDIQPNYIPQPRYSDYLDDSPRKRKATVSTDIPANLLSSRKSKTIVFSGKRSANKSGVVMSLHETCIKILIENIEELGETCRQNSGNIERFSKHNAKSRRLLQKLRALFDTGGVPFDILEPVLAKCTPAQLWNLEEYNPYFIEDTGSLWKMHCQRDFKETSTMNHDEWRTLYLEKHEEREKKLKSIDAKIKASQAAKQQVRQVKLAYVHTEAKAPPQVRRKQIKHGTSHVIVPPSTICPARISSTSSMTSSMTSSSRVPVVSPRKSKKTTALMKKVKQMGKLNRSRANSSIIRR